MKTKKRIIFAVYDDLEHEYRGYKTAISFIKAGYDVKIIGVRFSNKRLKGWNKVPYKRIRLLNNFPLILNMIIFWISLMLILIKEKTNCLYSHDIFPLFPVCLVSKLKRIPFIYDAHEFWHGNSQTENRPAAKKFWVSYEKLFIRSASKVITVSRSIAEELEKIYKIDNVSVFTNLPLKKSIPADKKKIHSMLGLDDDCRIVLYQGHFLVNNGLDKIIKAFSGVKCKSVLVLIGNGSEKQMLETLVLDLSLRDRVFFIGPFPHEELIQYTVCADIGLCLIKNHGRSYYYSTPNKMFEFIQAKVPQIASDFPEIASFVKGYNVGIVTDPSDQEMISQTIDSMLYDQDRLMKFRENCEKAAENLVWETYDEEFRTLFD